MPGAVTSLIGSDLHAPSRPEASSVTAPQGQQGHTPGIQTSERRRTTSPHSEGLRPIARAAKATDTRPSIRVLGMHETLASTRDRGTSPPASPPRRPAGFSQGRCCRLAYRPYIDEPCLGDRTGSYHSRRRHRTSRNENERRGS